MDDPKNPFPHKGLRRFADDYPKDLRKSETIAFRLTPDLHEALKRYLDDRPRESQTALIVDLLEGELTRLGYLRRDPRRDLFAETPGSPQAVARVADELSALTATLHDLRRRLVPR